VGEGFGRRQVGCRVEGKGRVRRNQEGELEYSEKKRMGEQLATPSNPKEGPFEKAQREQRKKGALNLASQMR